MSDLIQAAADALFMPWTVIILLAGGDKRTQAGDVRTALRLAHELSG